MLLSEMAIKSEEEVFGMEPLISLCSTETQNMEGEDLKNFIYNKISSVQIKRPYLITIKDIGAIISHHCTNRNKKKTAMLAIPYIINANHVTAPWRKKTDAKGVLKGKDKRLSGMISAPIMIDGEKYLCSLTIKKNSQGVITPYAISLKDEGGNIVEGEKMDDTFKAPDSNEKPTACGNASLDKVATSLGTTPSFDGASIEQNIQTNKENNQNNINCNRDMTKNKIRLTESQLHNLIKECVRKTLQEGKKKDPMLQWFGDFDKASKFRETMDYIKKGGRNPLKKSKTNNIKEGLMLNEYEDYVGEIYDGEPLGEIKDGEVREFARKMFIHVANEIRNLQRKYSDDYELCDDLQSIGELCMMAKCGL